MSCSVIKATNHNPVGHYYFAVDITVSNADRKLLEHINKIVMRGNGVISPIKGAFNLSARGKKRVQMVLNFLNRYPIIAGDLAKNRLVLVREALVYLQTYRGSSNHQTKTQVMDRIRMKLRMIKEKGIVSKSYDRKYANRDAVGHFLAGVLDGEGSFGFKKSKSGLQPFLAVAMKEEKMACTITKSTIQKFFEQYVRYSSRDIPCVMQDSVGEWNISNGSSTTIRGIQHQNWCWNDIV